VKEAIPLIERTFAESRNGSDKKNVAAWALTVLGVTQPYFNYLKGVSDIAVKRQSKFQEDRLFNENTRALQYFASIKSPEVQQFLESALDSPTPVPSEYALVNLLLGFPESEKAKDYLIELLKSGGGGPFRYQLAAAVNDPYINAKAPPPNRYDPDPTEQFAWIYRVHQKDWSIYNWVHNYTVNYTRPR
jgi:hypothetical protein